MLWTWVVLILVTWLPVVDRWLPAGWPWWARYALPLLGGAAGLAALRRWGGAWLGRRDGYAGRAYWARRARHVVPHALPLRGWARHALPLLVLAVVLAVGYPLANGGRLGGSDRDDALLVAGRALLDGRYPYDVRTYLDNPITPLPGALLLALPFAALGLIVLQNWVWPALFLATSGRLLGDRRRGLLVLVTLLGLAPLALNELAAGGDLLINSLYLWMGCAWLLLRLREKRPAWPVALLLGLFFASRVNFWVLGLVLLAAGGREVGGRRMARLGAGIGATTAALILPFYLYAPARFAPFHTFGELAALDAVWPGASVAVGLLTVGVTGVAAWGVWRGRWGWTAAGAAALAAPVLLAAALGLLLGMEGWLGYLRFGLAYLPWAALAWWADSIVYEGGGVGAICGGGRRHKRIARKVSVPYKTTAAKRT